jgi:hypothetical protein
MQASSIVLAARLAPELFQMALVLANEGDCAPSGAIASPHGDQAKMGLYAYRNIVKSVLGAA